MKNKKNLLVLTPLYPPHTGGLENHAFEFNRHMAQAGYTITVLTPLITPHTPARETQHANVFIMRFPAFEIIPNYPIPKIWRSEFWQMVKEAHNRKPSVIISRTRFFMTSPMALLYAKLSGIPWLHIEHGSDFVQLTDPFFSLVARIFDYTLGAITLRLADAVVANSEASADFVKQLAPNVAPRVIYRGIEQEKILAIKPNETVKEEYKEKLIITYLGRLISGKGVVDLIGAFATVHHPEKQLFIIGSGPEKTNLKNQVENLNLKNQVAFFGNTSWEDAISLLKISDIVVNPSYTEGLPTSVIEAVICKAAVIATNVGGTNEIIANQKSGILVEPRNPEQLAQAIQTLIDNLSQRTALTTQANSEIHKFSWQKSVEKYQEILAAISAK